jgi:hypothetical protein
MEMLLEVSMEVSMELRCSEISHIHNLSMVVELHGHTLPTPLDNKEKAVKRPQRKRRIIVIIHTRVHHKPHGEKLPQAEWKEKVNYANSSNNLATRRCS